jgi:hypothetical protein
MLLEDYELGRLLACLGDQDGAFRQFALILSDKYLEVGPSGKKGKYSMEVRYAALGLVLNVTNIITQSALHMRTHAAEQALKNGSTRL